MGYTKHEEFTLNPGALPKMIVIADNAEDDILAYPVGSGTNVNIRTQQNNKVSIFFLEAGHTGTWLGHTRKDCSFTIDCSGTDANKLCLELTKWFARVGNDNITDPINSRVLNVSANSTLLGVDITNINVNWAV
tara:strand:+ start:7677 stop:8078 length:402 start_codon:yes stop_codon:yes gene_type:complete